MEVSRRQDRRRTVAVATLGALALAAAVLLTAAAPGAVAATQCANARAHPGDATLSQLKRAVVCLINEKRENRGKRRLHRNAKLNGAASSHNAEMLAQNCFEHKCPGERGFAGRVRDSGYPDGADRWKGAENLGCATTPRSLIRVFLDKDFTRKNILNANFRDVGIGAGRGSPTPDTSNNCQPEADYVTYTVVLAWRRG